MNPLPGSLGSGKRLAWRLDQARYSATWDSGEGAYLSGGRWNSPGVRAVYCSVDPSIAILEVAVHKTFRVLDTGDALLTKHPFVLIPSAVPTHSWNLLFNAATAKGTYELVLQERFALDTRLHPVPKV